MSKMFYTISETAKELSITEDEVRRLSKLGRLREFRDGPRLMFKADQVQKLASGTSENGLFDDLPSDRPVENKTNSTPVFGNGKQCTREEVYRAIDEDREKQEETFERLKTEIPDIATELHLLGIYLNAANELIKNIAEDPATIKRKVLKITRRIASVATRCMENNGVE